MFRSNSKKSGFSIVEILIASGMLGILILGFISFMVMQQKEAKSLSQKLNTLDLEKLLMATLADGTVCTFELANPAASTNNPIKFDSTALPTTSPIAISQIRASAISTAPNIVQAGAFVPGSKELTISDISLSNISSAGIPDLFLGELNISFDESKLVHPLKPIKFRVTLRTNASSPNNNKEIQSCLTRLESPAAICALFGQVYEPVTQRCQNPCTPGPAELYTTDTTHTDACGVSYQLISGCYLANGNQVNGACLVGGGRYRSATSGSGCGRGMTCSDFSGGTHTGYSNARCGTCYNKLVRP
jgi:type II secretory pathway pseudopilin PulG